MTVLFSMRAPGVVLPAAAAAANANALVLRRGGGETLSMLQLPIPSEVTADCLRSIGHGRRDRHEDAFRVVLERCYSRLVRCADIGRTDCSFDVPPFVQGMPLYDVERCVDFVCVHLAGNGFEVSRTPGYSLLHIRWGRRAPTGGDDVPTGGGGGDKETTTTPQPQPPASSSSSFLDASQRGREAAAGRGGWPPPPHEANHGGRRHPPPPPRPISEFRPVSFLHAANNGDNGRAEPPPSSSFPRAPERRPSRAGRWRGFQ